MKRSFVDAGARRTEDCRVNTLIMGMLIGYVAGTASMLMTLYLARGSATIEHATANGMPAP